MKIYIVSIAGYPNFGDDLILKNWISFIRSVSNNCEIIIDVPEVSNVITYYNNMNIKTTSTVWNIIWSTEFSGDFNHYYELIKSTLNNRFHHLRNAILNLLDADVFHIVGGGFINKIWPQNLGMVYIGYYLKQRFNTVCYITGNSFYPFPPLHSNLDIFLSSYDYAESRDEQSHKRYKINYGFDDCYLDSYRCFANYQDNLKHLYADVFICLQSDLITNEFYATAIESLRNLILSLMTLNKSIAYIEAIPGIDHKAYLELSDLIPQKNLILANDVLRQSFPIREDQIWFSSRYHHHLLASMRGCRGCALVINNDYYFNKHDSLLKNGTGWSLWDVRTEDKIPNPTFSQSFIEKRDVIIYKKRSVAMDLYFNYL